MWYDFKREPLVVDKCSNAILVRPLDELLNCNYCRALLYLFQYIIYKYVNYTYGAMVLCRKIIVWPNVELFHKKPLLHFYEGACVLNLQSPQIWLELHVTDVTDVDRSSIIRNFCRWSILLYYSGIENKTYKKNLRKCEKDTQS